MRTPFTKFGVVKDEIVPLLTERITEELNPLYMLPLISTADIVILKGIPAVWFEIWLNVKWSSARGIVLNTPPSAVPA